MSILIKGMKMPDACKGCKFSWIDVGRVRYCNAEEQFGINVSEYNDRRFPYCPLIEVPDDKDGET